jgi:uncharacterized protein YjbI with pentapeptide repeats
MSRKTVIAIVGRIIIATVIAALMGGAWWLWQRLLTGPAVNWSDPYVAAILVGSVAALLWGVWWLWWWLPKRQVARLALKIRDPKARADTEDDFRKTVGQALGGAAVLIGAGAAYLQFSQQQQAASQQFLQQQETMSKQIAAQQKAAADQVAAQLEASEVNQKTSDDLRISNQVAKGFEQLANRDSVVMRLGGIFGLEGVMNTSKQYRVPVLEAFCAFVRDRTKNQTTEEAPETDIQAALTVIGRRTPGKGEVHLSAVRIPKANLSGADLSGADLNGAILTDADLSNAHLTGAQLTYADLPGAHLSGADLSGAALNGAILTDADLLRANLSDTRLAGANLNDADLSRADLSGADLNGANLSGANLSGARNLTQPQLDEACGSDVKLPPGLTLDKPCPP